MPAFIVCDQESTGARIRAVLTFGGQECPSSHIVPSDEAVARIGREPHVDLVVAAMPPDRERGLVLLSALARGSPGRVLAVGPTTEAKLVLRALRAGASDYVDSADLEPELESAIQRLAEAAAPPVAPGRLIAVLAPSGGSGSSTIAANLAVALAKEHGRSGLIDLNLESGDLAALLDLQPTFTLADLCQNAARLDRVMFERSLVKHDSGVHLLAPPREMHEAPQVRPEGVAQAVALARASFPQVVVDLDHSFHEEQLVVLRQADVVLIVLRLEFASIRNVRRTLDHLAGLGIDKDVVKVVVNRSGQPQEVPRAKAEEAIGRKIDAFVPEDAKGVNRAANQGTPILLSAPSAKVSRSLANLAREVGAPART